MKQYDIVGLGSCLVDYIAKVPKIIGPEEKVNVRTVTPGFGGPTTNNLVQATRLGLETVWIGQIGDDSNGKYIMDAFAAEKMDTDYVTVIPDAMSSMTWIAVNDNGDRAIYMCSNITSKITAEVVREKYAQVIGNARLFHTELCQLPLAPVLEGALIARENGVPVAVDYDVDVDIYINQNGLGTEQQLEALIQNTDIFKSGWGITSAMTGLSNPEHVAREILTKGPKLVAITMGEAGSLLATKERIVTVPAVQVKPEDTTGAGDAFMGGLGYGVLQGWPLERIGQFANACGSFCCRKIGAQQVGTLSEIEQFLIEYAK